MEGCAIVISRGTKCKKVERGTLGCIAKDFDFDVAKIGVKGDRHGDYNIVVRGDRKMYDVMVMN